MGVPDAEKHRLHNTVSKAMSQSHGLFILLCQLSIGFLVSDKCKSNTCPPAHCHMLKDQNVGSGTGSC